MSIIVTESCTQLVSEKSPIELSTQLKMQEYEDGVKMTKISDIDNNSCSLRVEPLGKGRTSGLRNQDKTT